MVFKLVQVDSENPAKINLNPGTHLFGRGKFLNVNDKRISRLHGQFEVTDDTLVITALHQNPCFYQKNGTTQAEILKKDNSVNLSNGDKLGLLPTSYWYEVLQCVPPDCEENKKSPDNVTDETKADSGGETDNEEESRLTPGTNANGVSNDGILESQSTQTLSSCVLNKESNSNDNLEKEKCEDAPSTSCVNSRLTPDVDTDKTETSEPGSPSLLNTNQEMEEQSNEAAPSSPEQDSATHKRQHSASEDEPNAEIKKIKTESDVKPDIKVDPDGQQASASNSNNYAGVQAPALPLRERCMYGASCYRRNPAHVAQFSHPRDADWGAGPRAPCPWGAACAKRDPRHWRDHDHPPGRQQPPPQPGKPTKKRSKRSKNTRGRASDESDSNKTDEESDESQNLIVTGKRARKPVINPSWIVSDEDSDPFKTDGESDEWEPSTNEYTESQNY